MLKSAGERGVVTTDERTVGRYLRWLLSAMALGVGVIHFAAAGDHFDVGWAHGAFFAVVAWCQLSWATAVLLRPARRLLVAGVLLNAGVAGVWVMSRVWGVPVGPNAWTPEPVSLADALSSVFEVGIVLLALAVLVRPTIAQRAIRPALALSNLGIALVAVAVVSTFAVTPSFATDHHAPHDGEAGGHAHSGATLNKASLARTPCKQSMPPGFAPPLLGPSGGHTHHGPAAWRPMASATRDELGRQLEIAHAVTLEYPTVRDAEAGGYELMTPYLPCIGAHYIKSPIFLGGFDPASPTMLLYDGTGADSKIVGLSYAMVADTRSPPEGFAGPNDIWHAHEGGSPFCVREGFVVDETAKNCAASGGTEVGFDSYWMNHVWVADAWPNSWGVFSPEHADLGGHIGDINAAPTKASRKAVARYFAGR